MIEASSHAQFSRRARGSKSRQRDNEPTLTDEKPILERVAEGDQAAVGDFISRYGDLVWSLARRYMGNHPDAEDAVQEIFIEIWKSAARYDRNVASEVAFISTITRRRLIDRLRSFERKPGMESIDDQIGAKQPAVAAGLNEDAEVAQVERVLGDMEPQHRQILAMSLYQGFSHSEIAERLDMPLGTVKTRVRRGLIHVREQLRIAEELDDSAEGATA
jgi:RNA polymerase sigma-70 factor (ECF subfamily)